MWSLLHHALNTVVLYVDACFIINVCPINSTFFAVCNTDMVNRLNLHVEHVMMGAVVIIGGGGVYRFFWGKGRYLW